MIAVRILPVGLVELPHVVGPQLVHAGNPPFGFGAREPLDLHDAPHARCGRREHEHVQGARPVGEDAVAAPADDDGVAHLRGVFDQLAGQAGELAVLEPERRGYIVRPLEAAHADRLDQSFDERADALVLGIHVGLGDVLLRSDGPHDFLVPDLPLQPLAQVAGNQAAPAAVLVGQREQGDRRVHLGSFRGGASRGPHFFRPESGWLAGNPRER